MMRAVGRCEYSTSDHAKGLYSLEHIVRVLLFLYPLDGLGFETPCFVYKTWVTLHFSHFDCKKGKVYPSTYVCI